MGGEYRIQVRGTRARALVTGLIQLSWWAAPVEPDTAIEGANPSMKVSANNRLFRVWRIFAVALILFVALVVIVSVRGHAAG
jgi:hypothetical protein